MLRHRHVLGVLLAAALLALLPAIAPASWADEPDQAPFLVIEIDRVSPDIVATASEPSVTVDATITNVGDRPVRDVVARLERADALTATSQLRTTHTDAATSAYQPVGPFLDTAAELKPGQRATVSFHYPIRLSEEPGLGIEHPGIYPLLVNVNGTPDYGSPARLGDSRFLLPVLGVPAAPEEDLASEGADEVVAPDTARPLQLTMLWPLADRPRLVPGVPGGTTPVRLLDDDLAGELSPDGRLDALVSAVEFATSPELDPDGELARTLCLAVDPDLLVTVNAMTLGYVVSENPDGRGALHPGTGQAAATAWLDRLRALAGRMCVTALPYAQADLDALHRLDDDRLSTFATVGASDLVDQLLGVTSVRGATLLGDGPLTPGAAALLDSHGPTVAVAPGATAVDLATGAPMTADVFPRRVGEHLTVAPFDPAVAATLGALGGTTPAPSYLDASLAVSTPPGSATALRQDALGALLWRGLRPDTEPRIQTVLPPPTWQAGPDDAAAVLTALTTLLHSGLARPHPLPDLINQTAATPPPIEVVDDRPTAGRIDDDVVAIIADRNDRLSGLTAALGTNVQTGLTGLAYTAPLREDMLRALSQAEPAAERNELARADLALLGRTIDDLFAAVTVVNPGGSYTLATERSPLPLALRNDLAVPIRVHLEVSGPPGMTVSDPGELELPPGYLPIRVPIEVHFTQRFAVDVALHTPDGLALGEPVRLSLHSNAYGKVLFFITLIAGVTLALLTGRRLWHRFRGQPDRADLEPAGPDHLHHRPSPEPESSE